ncbi:unnamed protein product, partial [Musa textilis]
MESTSDSMSTTTWPTIIEHMRSRSPGEGEVDWPLHLAVSGGGGGFGADKQQTARRLLFLLPLLALVLLADDGGEDKRGVLVAVQRLRTLTYPTLLSFLHACQPHPPPTVAAPLPAGTAPGAHAPNAGKRSFANTIQVCDSIFFFLSIYRNLLLSVFFLSIVASGSGCLQVSFRQRERRPSLLLSSVHHLSI